VRDRAGREEAAAAAAAVVITVGIILLTATTSWTFPLAITGGCCRKRSSVQQRQTVKTSLAARWFGFWIEQDALLLQLVQNIEIMPTA
jgi:hypothetical protein